MDDGCITLAATSPALLDQRIEKALSLLLAVLRSFKLVINWDGKTGCLLKYRGAGAHGASTARCSNGTPSIPVPDGVRLHINTQYKHTGSIVTSSGSCAPAARANASSTMNAWSKLAHKVFGSLKIQTALKMSLAQSLLFSGLFFRYRNLGSCLGWCFEVPGSHAHLGRSKDRWSLERQEARCPRSRYPQHDRREFKALSRRTFGAVLCAAGQVTICCLSHQARSYYTSCPAV